MKPLMRYGWWFALFYVLLVIPTVNLWRQTGGEISSLVYRTWNPAFFGALADWERPWGTIALDGALFTVIGLTGLVYFLMLYRACRLPDYEGPSLKGILFWTALFGLILMAVVPFHSHDLYGYINRGAQQAFYGLNPYVHPLADVPNWQTDPMFHDHWTDNPSPYGFFFTRLAQWVCTLAGPDFVAAALLFKGLNLLLHLAVTALVFHLGSRLDIDRPWLGAWLYGWNPLILLHVMANGHNDLWVPLGILLALWLLIEPGWRWLALPVLTLSVLTKYASLLAAPFMALALIRWRNWGALLTGLVFSAGVVYVLGWPYLQDWQQFPVDQMAKNAAMTQHSLNSMLSRSVFYLAKFFPALEPWAQPARTFFKPWLWLAFLMFCLWMLWRFLRDYRALRPTPGLVAPIALTMAVMLTIVSAKFHAWYIAMFFPLVFLLPEGAWVRRYALLLSGFQLLAFTPLQNIHVINYLLLTGVPLLWSIRWNPAPDSEVQ